MNVSDQICADSWQESEYTFAPQIGYKHEEDRNNLKSIVMDASTCTWKWKESEHVCTHVSTCLRIERENIYLILAIVTTRAKARSALCAGMYIQAPLATSAIRKVYIILAFTYSNILLLLLLVSKQNVDGKMAIRKRKIWPRKLLRKKHQSSITIHS